ncbi:MAG TPA: hypothetical protein VK470_09650 [Bacteroidota bacterium]|nr:hypothetical protein [Bacteroidota bacterium]
MRNFLILICCATAGLVFGCTDNVSSVGNALIGSNERFIIADTTLVGVSDTVFNVSAANGYGGSCVIGKTNETNALAWLRFTSTAVKDSLGACTIDTVELRLAISYTWNTPGTPAEFEIREALTPWTQEGLTRDSLSAAQYGTAVIGRITRTLAVNDTIVIPLDTATVRRMLAYAINPSSAAPFYGFVIIPKPGTTTGMFGYHTSNGSSTVMPTLTVRFHKNDNYDSLYFKYSEDTFVASAKATTNPVLEVRGGVSTWSKITFDLNQIPKESVINNATLELTQISASTQLGVGTPDSLFAFIARKGTDPSSIDSTRRIVGVRKSGTTSIDPVYVFTITTYAQLMIAPGSPYDGIVLHAADNSGSVDHMTLYSSKDPDASKRPRLLVTASKK